MRRFSIDVGAAAFAATSLDSLATTIVNTVGDVLGLTSDDLASRLATGESLTTVAATTGTSHNDLVAMVRATLPGGLSDTQAGALAEQLISTTWPPTAASLELPEDAAQTVDVTLTATAALLGTTATHLTGQLGRGLSLQGLATTAGISHDDLITAVTTDLGNATMLDGIDLATLAEQIATSTRSVAPPSTPSTTSTSTQARRFTVDLGAAALAAASPEDLSSTIVDTVSSFLGTTADDLTAGLSTGETLSTVADSFSAAHDELVAVIGAVLPGTLQDTQASAVAEQLANSTWPPSSDALRAPAATGKTLDVTLTATASLLGTAVAALATQLGAGASLDDLATAGGVSHDDLLAAVTTDLGNATTPDGIDLATLAGQITADAASTAPPPTTGSTPETGSGSTPVTGRDHHHHRHRHRAWL